MNAAELGAVLDAIAARAAALRDAGVREVVVDGIAVKLAPPEPKLSLDLAQTTQQDARHGVAEDPTTFGLPAGSQVPGIDWGPGYEEARQRRSRELGEKRG